MSDEEIILGLGEFAKQAKTSYMFDLAKAAALRISELNRQLDFARKQNQILGSSIKLCE